MVQGRFLKSQAQLARWKWNRTHNSQAVAEDSLPTISLLGLLQHHHQLGFSKTCVDITPPISVKEYVKQIKIYSQKSVDQSEEEVELEKANQGL